MTKPHPLPKQQSQQEEPAAPPLQSSPSAYQEGGVTWATSAISPANAAIPQRQPQTPGFSGLGKWSPSAPPRETSRPRAGAPLQERCDSECAGTTPPADGAVALPLAAASEARAHASTHAPPTRHYKGEGAPGANEKKEPGGSWAGCDNFFPGGVPKLCCPAREPAVPCGYLH